MLAIVVPDLFHATQTFFHEHIARIWPGRTVVIHLSATGRPALTDVPVLEIAAPPPLPVPKLPGLAPLVRQVNTWRGNRLSAAQTRAVAAFIAHHGVTHLFAEFATSGTVILPLARRLGLPLAVMSHGWDINVMGKAPQWRWRYARLYRSHARGIAVCDFLRGQMGRIGIPAERIAVIPCAVDAGGFVPVRHDAGLPKVVMISRLTPQKGPLHSIRAFALALAELPGLTLDIVGNGPLMGDVRAEIDRLGLAGSIRVHGDLDHQRCLAVMAQGHIFLQHCRTLPYQGIESQAVSLLEAMGHGLVPIVTRHGGMSDHVADGRRGWLVDEGDEAAMAARIVAMAADPGARARIGGAARDYVCAEFSRDAVYPRLRAAIGLPRDSGT